MKTQLPYRHLFNLQCLTQIAELNPAAMTGQSSVFPLPLLPLQTTTQRWLPMGRDQGQVRLLVVSSSQALLSTPSLSPIVTSNAPPLSAVSPPVYQPWGSHDISDIWCKSLPPPTCDQL